MLLCYRKVDHSLEPKPRIRHLDEYLFRSYLHAREIIKDWRIGYDLNRPHTSRDGLTPSEFAARRRRDHNMNRDCS